jgi:hypothetical protein
LVAITVYTYVPALAVAVAESSEILKRPPAYQAAPVLLIQKLPFAAVKLSARLSLVARVPVKESEAFDTRAVVEPFVSTNSIRAATVAPVGADFCTNVTEVDSPAAPPKSDCTVTNVPVVVSDETVVEVS